MRHGVMSLNQFASINIDGDAHRLTRFGRATIDYRCPMNKNVAALSGIDHSQLTDFSPIMPRNVKQSSISDLPAHLGIERRAIENNVYFVWLFARQHCFHN